MDYKEFKTEFNLAYNNISSNQAPGLDDVEISMYLSKGQVVLEDALYAEFEKSEEARRKLATLVVTAKLSEATNIPPNSKLYCSNDLHVYINTYQTPEDLRYIVNEQVKINDKADECIKNKFIKVQPVLLDELDTIIENPFKFNIKRALRLDASYNNKAYIEIITKQTSSNNCIEYYKIRYIKNPEPIFIYSSTDYPNDTIDGKSAPTTLQAGVDLGSLPKETHRQIVEIAAKMAYADYKN